MAFGIVNANFAVMDVVRFREDHPARIKRHKLSLDVSKIFVYFQADVVRPRSIFISPRAGRCSKTSNCNIRP